MLAGIGVGHEGHADHADRSLIGEGGLLVGGSSSRRRGIERGRGESNQGAHQCHRREQHHVAVVFADSHECENPQGPELVPPGNGGQGLTQGEMVPTERIELPTNGLQNRCSTAELRRR